MINPEYVDGLEIRIQELTAERDAAVLTQDEMALAMFDINKARAVAEDERDALAAHLERLRRLLVESQEFIGGDWRDRRDLALTETPKTSLARLKALWQAEALEELYRKVEGYPAVGRSTILNYAVDLRRQAGEKIRPWCPRCQGLGHYYVSKPIDAAIGFRGPCQAVEIECPLCSEGAE